LPANSKSRLRADAVTRSRPRQRLHSPPVHPDRTFLCLPSFYGTCGERSFSHVSAARPRRQTERLSRRRSARSVENGHRGNYCLNQTSRL
jgi:hypothetical protein